MSTYPSHQVLELRLTQTTSTDKANASLSEIARLDMQKAGKSGRSLTAKIGIPVLDVFRVEAMRESLGSDFTQSVMNFNASLPNVLKTLRSALSQKNQVYFQEIALSLKETAGNLGAVALANLSVQLLVAGKNKNTATARALMTKLEGEMQRAVDALSALDDENREK